VVFVQEFHLSGSGERCSRLNNQRPMIESHLGHHSDTDIESTAVAEPPEQHSDVKWPPHNVYAAGRYPTADADADAGDNLSELLDRRQLLEVLEALLVFQ